MPTYKVTDPTSGKQLSITGDSPPSETELNQIFNTVSTGRKPSEGMFQQGFGNTTPAEALLSILGGPIGNAAQPFVKDAINKAPVFGTQVRDMPGGSLVQGAAQPLLKMGEVAAELPVTLGKLGGAATGLRKITPEDQNPTFMSQDVADQAKKGLVPAAIEGARTGLGAASYFLPPLRALPGAGLYSTLANKAITGGVRGGMFGSDLGKEFNPLTTGATAAGGAILEPLMWLLSQGLSKGGLWKSMEKTAANKGDGTVVNQETLSEEAKQKMIDRMKATYKLHPEESDRILHKLMSDSNGGFGNFNQATGKLEPKEYTASQLLKLRSDLSPEASQNYIQRLFGFLGQQMNPKANLEAQVADSLRAAVSQNLNTAVPNMVPLNQLYGLYNNPAVGPAWSWPLRAAAGVGLGGAATKFVSGLSR